MLLVREVLVNGSEPFRSVCALQISMSSPRCSYHALFGAIPNNCSTWSYSKLWLHLYVSGLSTQSYPDRCQACIVITLYDELFYHLHNREKFLSPLVTKDNLDRCPVIHSWITLVPLD